MFQRMTLQVASRFNSALRGSAAAFVLTVVSAAAPLAQAQSKPAASAPPSRPATSAGTEQGPAWSTLKPAQREALKPLERDWVSIDSLRKRKWLEIAERYPSMAATDQARLQARMAEWAKLTPLERGQARVNYQEAKQQAPAQDRQASWDAYQALPAGQRRELADRTAPAAARARRAGPIVAKSVPSAQPDKRTREEPQPKSNTVPDAARAALPKPVAPTVVQVQPGATTTLMSKQPTPPAHQPSGMPKIAATPEFVDKKTLLPQTGAQSAAPRPVTASAPSARP